MRILLTEDDDSVRSFVSRALELDGHKVDTACDGAEALERLTDREGRYDLLVSDVKMTVMDAIALAHQAAGHWPGLPILLMTGYADQRGRADDLSQVIGGVLPNPCTLEQIREAVTEAAAPETSTEKSA